MTPCALHGGISTTLCGCGSQPEAAQKPDTHRDFTELAVGTRVRFAGTTREIAECPQCGLPAVPVEDTKTRRWPFKVDGMAIERKALRKIYVHDAEIGQTGYLVGGGCAVYERSKK